MDLGTVALIALLAGLAGGAVGGVAIGAIQAWMARPKGVRVSRAYRWTKTSGSVRAAEVAAPSGGIGPFDRFSAGGKRVFALAQAEAIQHNHNYIGTEHLLGALLRDTDTIAARALTSLGIDLTKVRTALEFIVGRGDQPTSGGEITLSPRTKNVIELAVEEAAHMNQHVGPEHILLALIDEGEGIASGILESLGAPLETVRARVLELLAASGTPPPEGYTPSPRRRQPSGFDRFSNRAKRALALAQGEAVRIGHSYIGPEHLLLGIARLTGPGQVDQAMKRIFDELGLTVERLRAELAKVIPPVDQQSPTEIVLSPETKEIFDLVLRESGADKAVLPEHLLLAIVRDEESFAPQILSRLGVTAERVRTAVGH
ncbi:MAG: Clp protease N-terminal domain-containing protein [Candidatus Limnocylindria bacterium]